MVAIIVVIFFYTSDRRGDRSQGWCWYASSHRSADLASQDSRDLCKNSKMPILSSLYRNIGTLGSSLMGSDNGPWDAAQAGS